MPPTKAAPAHPSTHAYPDASQQWRLSFSPSEQHWTLPAGL